jgi:exopolysaccharide biosynthesis polyprenyl glycosylphosphotransferase
MASPECFLKSRTQTPSFRRSSDSKAVPGPPARCARVWKDLVVKDSKGRLAASSGKRHKVFSAQQAQRAKTRKLHRSIAGADGAFKRATDIAVSSTALVVLAPVMAAVALLIRLLDGGPVLYKQVRVGLGGARFTILKFRTMRCDAEEGLGPMWSLKQDPRCTSFGAWLRRRGIDELPQLWNILRGDMTLVGPRPERPEFVNEFSMSYPGYDARHAVRCGLTGYAQVHGWRGDTAVENRLRHDLYYIRNWSIGLDFRILVLTLLRGWSERTRNGV